MNHQLRLSRLSARERSIVAILRGMAHPALSEVVIQMLNRFRRLAEEHGLRMLAPEAIVLGDSEIRILGILTMLQRPRSQCEFVASAALRDALTDCATRLADANLHLAYRDLSRIHGTGEHGDLLQTKPLCRKRRRPDVCEPFSPPPASTLADRALRFVSDRRYVGWESLSAFGLTRQFVRLMLNRGLLTRDTGETYRASPEALRWLTASSNPEWQCGADL